MPFNQPLAGLVEPAARTWKTASAAERKSFYQMAGKLAVAAKRAELTRAIGANGRRMKPRKRPRPDGAEGPVLTPHDAASRTDRLMDYRAWQGGLTLFWHSGMNKATRKPWGTILGYHAAGKVRGAPKRDVRLSKRGRAGVAKAMASWWTKYLRARPKPTPAATPAKKPGVFSRAQKALIGKYKYLKGYFRPKGEGI